MQKTILIILALIIVAIGGWYFLFLSGGTSGPDVEVNAVAMVNGEVIEREDFDSLRSQVYAQQGIDESSFDQETKEQFDRQIVNELVNQALIKQAIERSGITVSQEDVDVQINLLASQFEDQDAYEKALVDEGISEDELRKQISDSVAVQTYLEQELNLSSLSASEKEIEDMYNEFSAQDENIASLEELRDQIEGMVIQQKQQTLIAQFIEQLHQEADIEILI